MGHPSLYHIGDRETMCDVCVTIQWTGRLVRLHVVRNICYQASVSLSRDRTVIQGELGLQKACRKRVLNPCETHVFTSSEGTRSQRNINEWRQTSPQGHTRLYEIGDRGKILGCSLDHGYIRWAVPSTIAEAVRACPIASGTDSNTCVVSGPNIYCIRLSRAGNIVEKKRTFCCTRLVCRSQTFCGTWISLACKPLGGEIY
jgi:hypothetical protein